MDGIEDSEMSMQLSDGEMTKLMFAVAKAEDLDSLKQLISAGFDPLAECSRGNNLLITLYHTLNYTSSKNKVLQIIDYVLNLPQYQEITEKSEKVYRNVLLELAEEFYKNFEIVSQMLKHIFKFNKINKLIFEIDINLFFLRDGNANINPTAYFVYKYLENSWMNDKTTVFKMLRSLKEIGFSTQESSGCITILTILTLFFFYSDIAQEIMEYTLAEFTVNVESCTIYIYDSTSTEKSDIRLKWLIPDVLYLSCYRNDEKLVKIFLPYWWGPPLALMYFPEISTYQFLKVLLPELRSGGGIPHGTEMFRCVESKKLEVLRDRLRPFMYIYLEIYMDLFENGTQDWLCICDSYQELVVSPMRLTDLAKYAVRHSFAERATQPDTNLPMLLRQNLPKLLYTVCTE